MEEKKYDVFISYSRKDYVDESLNVIPDNEVSKIKEALTKAGITFWMDEKGIVPGEDYAAKIVKYIKASKIFVYISSKNANESDWTRKEIACALMYKKNLIPVLIDDSPFHDSVMLRIVDLDRIDYYLNSQNGIIKLTHSINTYLAEEKAAETKRVEDEKRRQEELERQRDANVYYLTGNEYYSGLNGKIIDYSEAVYWFRKGVELGHLEAMYSLGYCYFHGSGVPHDYSKAKNLFEQAAQLGHMKAQFNLGKCYKKGYGTPINYSEAFAWFLKAAEQGYVLAQNNVAVCYEQGIGVPVNEEEAVKWYQLANEQGDAFAHDALVRLGKLHE